MGREGGRAHPALGPGQDDEEAGGAVDSRSPPMTRRIVCAQPPADMILPATSSTCTGSWTTARAPASMASPSAAALPSGLATTMARYG